MQLLERVHLVQFFLFEAQTLELSPTSAIIAPNGAGKSALLDALQIVLLGGDRSRIRFNAQAGGSARARSIRDYCLGTWRSGEEGRKRRTATTYISLVFRDQDSGLPLTAGIALGASADEPEHRVYSQYIVPGVALSLDDHLERINGRELPLAWAGFRELLARRCREAGVGAGPELHAGSERFLKDLLLRLRAAPAGQPDVNAYRKAFQNALNLQRVEDVDLFVRTLVAEDRPTDIARFRSLLDTFRQLKEKIEQVVARIGAAEGVDAQYEKIAQQATRAASCRALAAEYARDLLSEQVEQAEAACEAATRQLADTRRALGEASSEQAAIEDAHAQAQARLQGSAGYGEQAQIDELAGRDRGELARLKRELTRSVGMVREQWQAAARLDLPALDAAALAQAQAAWQRWYDALAALPVDAELPWQPAALFAEAQQALIGAQPLIDAVDGHARALHASVDQAQGRLAAARQNQKRLAAGKAELHPDVVRLMHYLQDEGIEARPVCDLVRVRDPAWQGAIEAYLRGNVEALLIPAADEERAVKLYRALAGGRSVYGVKLALSSAARRAPEDPKPGSVAALLEGDNVEALAFLRRTLGELRCVDSEAELIAARNGLTRDGLLAKGGSIERRRLPAADELKVGASDNRARLRVLREDIEAAERELRELEPALRRVDACQRGLAPLADPDRIAQALHDAALEHRQVLRRYRDAQEGREAARNPDLLRASEQLRELAEQLAACRSRRDALLGRVALDEGAETAAQRLLDGLRGQEDLVARRAVEAFREADVDPNRVERLREEMDTKWPALEERGARCEERAKDSDRQLDNLKPEAWGALSQYAKDHGLALELAPGDWRAARSLLARELAQLRESELANYQRQADEAYGTATETFRSNVASALYDNFSKLKYQIGTLNRTLRASPAFSNNERYQFHYEVAPEYRELHRFIQRVADVGGEDGLFGSAGEVPAAFRELIEDNAAQRGAASALDDYRRFFRFEVQIRQDDKVIGSLSERMRSGSGGEHRAPLYVIAGAALAAAYGKSAAHPGGLGLILLDEFGDKIDAQNARATVDYLRSLGLQLILAAPDTAQGTLSGVLDSYIELFRDGDLLQAEHIEVGEAARALLLSDQFDLHPRLLAEEAARIAAGKAEA